MPFWTWLAPVRRGGAEPVAGVEVAGGVCWAKSFGAAVKKAVSAASLLKKVRRVLRFIDSLLTKGAGMPLRGSEHEAQRHKFIASGRRRFCRAEQSRKRAAACRSHPLAPEVLRWPQARRDPRSPACGWDAT